MQKLKHKATTQIPRHLQSYNYLENAEHHKGKTPLFAGCIMAASKKNVEPMPVDEEISVSMMSQALEVREKRCEEWLDDYASSLNEKNLIPGHLAFQTFAPHDKEPLSAIFAKHSGSSK